MRRNLILHESLISNHDLDFRPTPLPSSTGDASAVVDPEVLSNEPNRTLKVQNFQSFHLSATLIEPTMYSLGLGSWWPWGRMQIFLEWMHIEQGLPWWGAIMVGKGSLNCLPILEKCLILFLLQQRPSSVSASFLSSSNLRKTLPKWRKSVPK